MLEAQSREASLQRGEPEAAWLTQELELELFYQELELKGICPGL